MVITWYGQACFKIQSGDLVIVIDPFSKDIGLTPPRMRADIVLVTHQHPDHNNVAALAGEPFVITGPGEYETKSVYVHGIPTFHDDSSGKVRGLNTAYTITVEDITILHLGDFGESTLRTETIDQLGEADIVMIPVGSVYTIDGASAAKVIKQLEPRYVIPMHYGIKGLSLKLEGVDSFLKESGASKIEPQDKFAVRKKDIDEEEKTEIILLKTA